LRVIGIRTRFYEIEDQATRKVSTKEGLHFVADEGTMTWLGAYTTRVTIAPADFRSRVAQQRGFTYLEFVRSDNRRESLFCLITQLTPDGQVSLYDLEQEGRHPPLQCHLMMIDTLLSDTILYQRGPEPTAHSTP
jgi:hypothetical protein